MTATFRRSSIYALPGALLFHALAMRTVSTPMMWASLAAAAAAVLAGIYLRWFAKHTTPLLLVHVATIVFFAMYTFGTAMPTSYLLFLNRSDLAWLLGPINASLFASVFAWRFITHLRNDWSGPTDTAPGVKMRGNRLDYMPPDDATFFLGIVLLLGVSLLVITMLFRGDALYEPLAILTAPYFIGLVGSDIAARTAAFCHVFRKLEKKRGARFELFPLR